MSSAARTNHPVRTTLRVAGAVISASAIAVVGPAAIPANATQAGVVTTGHSPASTYAAASASSVSPTSLPEAGTRTVRVY